MRGPSHAFYAFGAGSVLVGLFVGSCISFDGLSGGERDAGTPPPKTDGSPSSDGGDAPKDAQAPPADASPDAFTDADAATSSYAARILADHPVGYWRFEETSGTVARDSSGHGHDGTYGANVVLGQAGLVAEGFAAKFDGSPEAGTRHFVQIPESQGLEPTSSVTFECWVSMLSASNAGIVSYGSDGPAPFESYVLQFGSGAPGAYIVASGSGFSVDTSQAISIAQSHYLAVVYNGATLRLYVDGMAVAATNVSGPLGNYDLANGLGIGSTFTATRQNFDGLLDEVAVYDAALTAKQIALHYAAGLR